ncbi:tRNA (guanine(46)-N(7))-methyltransferase TrmB [Thalassotalea agarivorans]|uniref:tRNA (guanine(46)-N(7))-methyltransferase n=1 Tax=Thalassotalea agarivorans TaxID=349064 RepID=A0A1I0GNS8_THASX|nr:SAM-dependent methyltransferase [Thalassotalea agarivorans]SET72039.1 tRNA G46 methylase TrmB [Thalassotalea agarivorans]
MSDIETTPSGDSKAIISNQTGIHDNLQKIVEKHAKHAFQKPIQAHTQIAFDEVNKLVQAHQGDIILDACCGVGQSTRILAQQHPDALVIGVDKSANRIERQVEDIWSADNYVLVRADLNDFFRLVEQAKWPVTKHYVLYPNPWPKSKHVQRRWHGSAVFPTMLNIGKEMILRSNWRLYLEEFQYAAQLLNISSEISAVAPAQQALTPFEAKYQNSSQQCWQLKLKLS